MAAPLSIIIPTRNAAKIIGPTLAALATAIGEGLIRELIIADAGSPDEIAAIANGAGAVFLTTAPGRGPQLAAGAEKATGAWLLFLHADTTLSPNWPTAIRSHISQFPDKAGFFRLKFDALGIAARLIANWANFRSRRLGLPYGDQGLLISRQLYRQSGGYAPIPLFEDVDLARRLRNHLRRLDATATTSAERYLQRGWIRHGLENHLALLRYNLGVNPETLARRYDRPLSGGKL